MSEPRPKKTFPQVTQLLEAWRCGDGAALEKLVPLVYDELRRLAAGYLRDERGEHTLQPTALVHEAYLKLVDKEHPRWQGREHFMAVAAQLMRRILVDHARQRGAVKRGGGLIQVTLREDVAQADAAPVDVLALDAALEKLAARDPRKARVVELRFFAGLTLAETATVLRLAVPTVSKEARLARAWLHRELTRSDPTSMARQGESP